MYSFASHFLALTVNNIKKSAYIVGICTHTSIHKIIPHAELT